MKTPRELLLERHRNAERQLAEIRRGVVGSIGAAQQQEAVSIWTRIMGVPWRNWATVGVAWLCIAWLNLQGNEPNLSDGSVAETSREEMAQDLRAYRELLREVMGSAPELSASTGPRTAAELKQVNV